MYARRPRLLVRPPLRELRLRSGFTAACLALTLLRRMNRTPECYIDIRGISAGALGITASVPVYQCAWYPRVCTTASSGAPYISVPGTRLE